VVAADRSGGHPHKLVAGFEPLVVAPTTGGLHATHLRGRSPHEPGDLHLLPTYDRRELGAIFCGGVVGALARTGLAQASPDSAHSWPWTIFAVNVVGAFMLGYFVTRLQERLPTSAYKRPFLGTGLCGALTTFSTVQLELLKMVQAREWSLAIAYAAATLAAGSLAVALATALVRRVRTIL
jgi:CrcB protein